MRLTKVEVSNFGCFKHSQFAIDPAQAIFGENGSGKSTILKAVELGITGKIYNPLTGKEDDLLDYVGFHDEQYTIVLYFADPEFQITRTFKRQEQKGSTYKITQEASIYPRPEEYQHTDRLGVSQVNEWCRKTFGNIYMFSFAKFFTESPRKQFEILSNMIPLEYTAAQLRADILLDMEDAGIKTEGVAGLPEGMVIENLSGLNLVNNALSHAEQKEKEIRAKVDSMKKTVRSLSEIKQEFEKVAETIEGLEKKKAEFTGDLEKNRQEQNKTETAAKEYTRAKQELEHIRHSIEKKQNELDNDPFDPAKEKGDRVERFEQLIGEIKKQEKILKEAEAEAAELKKEIKEFDAIYRKHQADYIRKDVYAEMLKVVETQDICPVCERDLPDGKSQAYKTTISNLTIPPLEIDFAADQQKLAKRQQAIDSVIETAKDILKKSEWQRDQIKDYLEKIDARIEDHQQRRETVQNEINGLELKKVEFEKTIAEYAPPYAGIAELITGLKLSLQETETKLKAAYELNGILLAQQKAANQYQEMRQALETATAIKTIVLTLKRNAVKKAFAPVIDQVRSIFTSLDADYPFTPLIKFEDDRGNDVFLLGLEPKKPTSPLPEFVPFHKVNTGHQVKLLIALLLSLPVNEYRLIMLDEMEKISQTFEENFQEGLITLRNEFDNFIFTTSRKYSTRPDTAEPEKVGAVSWLTLN